MFGQNKTFMGKMWTPENPNAEFSISSRDQNFNKWNYENKDVSVQDNKYIRLKSLVIGYTLPQVWTAKAGLSKVRIYFSGDDSGSGLRLRMVTIQSLVRHPTTLSLSVAN